MQDKSDRRNVGTWKQVKKETRTVARYNDITTKFSKLKGWPSQSLINQPLLRKSALEAVYAGYVLLVQKKIVIQLS